MHGCVLQGLNGGCLAAVQIIEMASEPSRRMNDRPLSLR